MKLPAQLFFSILACLSAVEFAGAAVDRQSEFDRIKASIEKKHRYVENGTIIGGEAGTQTSVLSMRRLYAPKDGIERIVLDMGDRYGKPLKGQVGYFHVSLDRERSKLVVVLEQTQSSAVDQKKLKDIFKLSPFVKNARILFDPHDRGITIEMDLKRKVVVEASHLPSNK